MRTCGMSAICGLVVIGILAPAMGATTSTVGDSILGQTFDLAGDRSPEVQAFEMESRLLTYALDGKRVSTDVFRLRLKCTPAKLSGKAADEYTCTRFTVQFAGGPEVSVPVLDNWTYSSSSVATGFDDKGQVFGIDHAKFEKLVDANGKAIPPGKVYHVYNAFIDFHGFCDVFARPIAGGRGIQDLKTIGKRIVHAAAFTEPPVNLGSNTAEGSTFKNGEVTMEFKGLSSVDGAACAIVAFDSGESSFQMISKPMPNMEVRSVGSSHYLGDIYIDLASKWVRKARMYELVVTETTVPALPNKINAVIERDIVIRNVDTNAAMSYTHETTNVQSAG